MITKKVCMLGAFAVGKTSLVQRFVSSIFSDKYLTTVGVKIDKKVMRVDGAELTLVLWDIHGETDVIPLTSAYLRGASGHLVVIDGTRPETVEVAKRLHGMVAGDRSNIPGVLLLNKSDLVDEWRIPPPIEAELAGLGWPVLRTSAKTGQGVERAFEQLAHKLLE